MWRNNDYLRLARGKPCIHCGIADGTVVSCHYSGLYAGTLGKSGGRKATDIAVAHLCSDCHKMFDNYAAGNDDERAARFMRDILMTIDRLLETGEIKIEPTNVPAVPDL